jgi:hypothetical protein
LPPLPEADAASLLQLEAERGFPCDVTTLRLAHSRCPLPAGKQLVTLAGILNSQLTSLEQVLAAAKLKPVSFSPGVTALQPSGGGARLSSAAAATNVEGATGGDTRAPGVLALAIGENQVSLQITCGGGVAALRTLEGAIENEGSRRTLHTGYVAREVASRSGSCPPDCAPPSAASAFSAHPTWRSNWPTKWNCGLNRPAWASNQLRSICRTNSASSFRPTRPFHRPSAWPPGG